MPDSRRQQVCAAVLTRFQAILTAGGYASNLGANVSEWRAAPFEEPELPAGNLMDVKCETQQLPSRVHHHKLLFEFEVSTEPGLNASAVRSLIADVTAALGVDRTFGGLAFNTDPLDDELGFQHESRVVAGFVYRFVVEYRTQSFAPYT